jgi:hypothetical protein
MAQLRLSIFEYRNAMFKESEIDHEWLQVCCDRISENHIYALVFHIVTRDPARIKVAMPAISWAVCKRDEDFASFLRSQMENLALQFGNSAQMQLAHDIRRACGGLVHICEDAAGIRIYMEKEVRDWIQQYRSEEVPFAKAHKHALQAVDNMLYIRQAYEQRHHAPCPNDTSMENLIHRYPGLESTARSFLVNLKGAQELVMGSESWVQILGIIWNTQFLLCLKQIQGARLDKDRFNGWSQGYPHEISPLAWAASENLPALVAHFLSSGCTLENRGSDGLTALAAAAQNGHREIVAYLLQSGADLEARDIAGDTPLALAASYGQHEVMRLLISQGANIESRSDDLATPLVIAASNAQDEAVIILHESNAYSPDVYGETFVSHMIRHSPDDHSLHFPLTGGEWLHQIPFGGHSHTAICRAMYYNSNTSNRRAYEKFLGSTDRDSQPPSIPFGYIPGALRQQYVLGEKLGRGSFGVCYSATDRLTGRIRAVKGSQLLRSTDPESLHRRYHDEKVELDFLKTIKHKNVMCLQNYIDKNKNIFMVFDIADCNLTDYMQHNKMSHNAIRRMTIELLSGTEYLVSNDLHLKR